MSQDFSNTITFRNRNFSRAFLLFIVTILVCFSAVAVNPALLPFCILFISLLLYLADQKYLLVILYLGFLPTNGLITREYFILGSLGIQQLLAIFASLCLLKTKSPPLSNKFGRFAIMVLMFIVSYLIYVGFKNAFFGMHELSWSSATLRGVNVIILYYPLYLLLKRSESLIVRSWMLMGVTLGILNLAVFCFLSPILPTWGFYSYGTEAFFSSGPDGVSRFSGVMGNGDSNTLGTVFVIAVGFFLSRPNDLMKSNLIRLLIGISLTAMALTASRTAFIALLMVIFLMFFQRGKSKVKMQVLVGGLLFIVASFPLWETILARFSGAGEEQLALNTSSNRIGKWVLYFQHFLSHPESFIYGSPEPILVGFKNIFIAAHNFFIQVIYNAGLLFVVALLYIYAQISKVIWNKKSKQNLGLIFFPMLAINFFVSDVGAFIYFIVFLALYEPIQDKFKPNEDLVQKLITE